jgi:integrase/recombinase XerC
LIVALGVGLGLRRAEICGLEVGDWDAYSRTVIVRHQSKGGHQRVLPVPDHVAQCIERYIGSRIGGGAGPLIRATDRPWKGITANRVGFLITQWMFAAGLKTSIHDGKSTHALRHSFAQMLYRHGGDSDLRLIQHALGHSHLASTEIYMRATIDTERLRNAMANVDYGLSA